MKRTMTNATAAAALFLFCAMCHADEPVDWSGWLTSIEEGQAAQKAEPDKALLIYFARGDGGAADKLVEREIPDWREA